MGFLERRRTKNSATGRTELLQLIQSHKWKEAIARARALPLEVSEWYVEKYEDHHICHPIIRSTGSYLQNACNPNHYHQKQKVIMERLLPLHLACELNAPFDLIATLLDVYPEATMMREYGQGSTPLHLACTSPVIEAVGDINMLSEAGLVQRQTGENSNRSRQKTQARTLQLLLSYYPKSIQVTNSLGQLPIHLACAGNLDHEVINSLLNAWNELSKYESPSPTSKGRNDVPASSSCLEQKDKRGNIPLHSLCQSVTIHRDAMSLLLSKAPHTVHIRNYAGETAADVVNVGWCGNKRAMLDLLKKDAIYWKLYASGGSLLKNSETAEGLDEVEVTTKSGLQKHLERIKGFKDDNTCNIIVHYLLSHPEEAALFFCMKDSDGSTWRRFLPLHLAIEKCANVKVISSLLKVYPDSVRKTNNNRQLPLSLSCEYAHDHNVFVDILSKFKGALKHIDSFGMTCLHSACWGGANIESIKTIISHYPEALNIQDRFGRSPRKIAELRGHTEIANFLGSHDTAEKEAEVSQSAQKLSNSLMELIEQRMWCDVLNKCVSERITPYHLQSVLKYRPPSQVVKRFLEKGQINLDELNLAIDVATKMECSKGVVSILEGRRNELFPLPDVELAPSLILEDNIDGIILVKTESLDSSDIGRMPKMGIVHKYLNQQKSVRQQPILNVKSSETTIFIPITDANAIIDKAKSHDREGFHAVVSGETEVESQYIQHPDTDGNAARHSTDFFHADATNKMEVEYQYVQQPYDATFVSYTDEIDITTRHDAKVFQAAASNKIEVESQYIQQSAIFVPCADGDFASDISTRNDTKVFQIATSTSNEIEVESQYVQQPYDAALSPDNNVTLSPPLVCCSTNTEIRSNADPPLNHRSDSNSEDEINYSTEADKIVQKRSLVDNDKDKGPDVDLDLAESYFLELDRRLSAREVQHQLMDNTMSRSTSNSSDSASHRRSDSVSNGSIQQYYTERDRRLSAESLSFDPILSNELSPKHKPELVDQRSTSRPEIIQSVSVGKRSIREETLVNFGLFANANESYSSLLSVNDKGSSNEPSSPLSSEAEESPDKSNLSLKSNPILRLSPLPEEEENFNKVETNYPVDDYISEILPSFGFVLGGIVMGLTFRYIVIYFPTLSMFSLILGLLISTFTSEKEDNSLQKLMSIISTYIKRVNLKSKVYTIQPRWAALQGKAPRMPFPIEAQQEATQRITEFTAMRASLAMGLLGGIIFWIFSRDDSLGWTLVGSFLFSSTTYIDDEKGDFARCLGMIVYVALYEASSTTEMLLRLYERVCTKYLLVLKESYEKSMKHRLVMSGRKD